MNKQEIIVELCRAVVAEADKQEIYRKLWTEEQTKCKKGRCREIEGIALTLSQDIPKQEIAKGEKEPF